MKTIATLLLTTSMALTGTMAASAQYWNPYDAPHTHSRYYQNRYNGFGTHHSTTRHPGLGYYSFRCPVSLEGGLVSKRFVTRFGPYDRYCENLWGVEGSFMNGMQLGLAYQPTTPSGLGFRSGMFYEIYFANGRGVSDEGYNRFTEHDLYIPAQLNYDIRVAPGIDVNLSTGLGFNVALAGVYRSWGRGGRTDYQHYGNYNAPDRINAMWEFGANVRFDHFKVGFDYGLGLNDQEFYDHARTRQNKFSLTAGVVF